MGRDGDDVSRIIGFDEQSIFNDEG
jgi:hypothetical protein